MLHVLPLLFYHCLMNNPLIEKTHGTIDKNSGMWKPFILSFGGLFLGPFPLGFVCLVDAEHKVQHPLLLRLKTILTDWHHVTFYYHNICHRPVTYMLTSSCIALSLQSDMHFPPYCYEFLKVYLRSVGALTWSRKTVMFEMIHRISGCFTVVEQSEPSAVASCPTEEEKNNNQQLINRF